MDTLTTHQMKAHPPRILQSMILFGLIMAGGLPAQQVPPAPPEIGAQIGWASNAFATNLRADGFTTFEAGALPVFFQLGAFDPGFDPAKQDLGLWKDAWTPLANALYNSDDQQVIATSTLTNNDSPFQYGSQAWIWAFTSQDVKPDSEWLLVAVPSWLWPDKSAPLPVTFSMGDALPGHAVIGDVNPANGAFHMRLESIPEPGSVALLIFPAFALALRRRRDNAVA